MSAAGRYQLVLCDGPRCRARGQLGAQLSHLRARLAADAALGARVSIGLHSCLARCPAGPSLVVRALRSGAAGLPATPDPAPGLYALDGGCHYHAVSPALLDRILDEHCSGAPLEGRYQPY